MKFSCLIYFRVMSGLVFLHRRFLSPSCRRVGRLVFNRVIPGRIAEVAKLATSAALRKKDDCVKSDPDANNLLREINRAFDDNNKPHKHSEEHTDKKEAALNCEKHKEDHAGNKEAAADNVAAGKNISQLLSELYGEEGEKNDTYSSVGELMAYF